MPLTIVHFTTDSLPRVVTGSSGTSALDVLLPFRVDLDDPALSVTGWHLDVEVDGRSWVSRVRTRRLRADLADALRTLAPDQRRVLVLFYLCDQSVESIAQETSTRPGTVRVQLSRGRAALALALGEHERAPGRNGSTTEARHV